MLDRDDDPHTGTLPVPQRLSILIVDDDDLMRGALARVFRGHQVALATSVAEALALIATGRRFDTVVSDVMMPGNTGVDFYRELQRRAPLLASRIVFVTGGGLSPEIEEFLRRCCRPVVAKPFSRTELRRVVEEAVRHIDWATMVGLGVRAWRQKTLS